jgi:hypothetical protein
VEKSKIEAQISKKGSAQSMTAVIRTTFAILITLLSLIITLGNRK